MDHAFFRRARRLLDGRAPAALDHRLLLDAATARQGASPTAQMLARRCGNGERAPGESLPVVDLILGEAGWRQAVITQCGRFSRIVLERPRNEP